MSNTHTNAATTIGPGSPVFWGSAGAMLVAVGLLALGGFLFTGTTPITLNVALLVLALVEGVTGYFTLQGKRVAWAFSLSINGTGAVVMLFSAPRIRDAADISILLALLPCMIFGLLVLLQSLRTEEF